MQLGYSEANVKQKEEETTMNLLKKGAMTLFVMIMAVMLVACGVKVETKTYKLYKNGVDIKITYTYRGDKVIKQTAENIVPYTSLGVTSKEEAEKILKDLSDKFQGVEGLKEELEYKDDKVVETLEIDYTKASIDEIKELPGVTMGEGDVSKGVSLKRSAKELESQGFKEVKK